MTTLAARSRKVVGSISCFSTSDDNTRPHIQVPRQLAQQSSMFKPDSHALMPAVALSDGAAPPSQASALSSPALKSP